MLSLKWRSANRWPPSTTLDRVGHVLGAAQRHPIGLHHGRQHLLAGIHTQ